MQTHLTSKHLSRQHLMLHSSNIPRAVIFNMTTQPNTQRHTQIQTQTQGHTNTEFNCGQIGKVLISGKFGYQIHPPSHRQAPTHPHPHPHTHTHTPSTKTATLTIHMRVYTHRGWAHWQHNIFDSEKRTNCSHAPDRVWTQVTDVVEPWVWCSSNWAALSLYTETKEVRKKWLPKPGFKPTHNL